MVAAKWKVLERMGRFCDRHTVCTTPLVHVRYVFEIISENCIPKLWLASRRGVPGAGAALGHGSAGAAHCGRPWGAAGSHRRRRRVHR